MVHRVPCCVYVRGQVTEGDDDNDERGVLSLPLIAATAAVVALQDSHSRRRAAAAAAAAAGYVVLADEGCSVVATTTTDGSGRAGEPSRARGEDRDVE